TTTTTTMTNKSSTTTPARPPTHQRRGRCVGTVPRDAFREREPIGVADDDDDDDDDDEFQEKATKPFFAGV
mgnify:CR=1